MCAFQDLTIKSVRPRRFPVQDRSSLAAGSCRPYPIVLTMLNRSRCNVAAVTIGCLLLGGCAATTDTQHLRSAKGMPPLTVGKAELDLPNEDHTFGFRSISRDLSIYFENAVAQSGAFRPLPPEPEPGELVLRASITSVPASILDIRKGTDPTVGLAQATFDLGWWTLQLVSLGTIPTVDTFTYKCDAAIDQSGVPIFHRLYDISGFRFQVLAAGDSNVRGVMKDIVTKCTARIVSDLVTDNVLPHD